MKPGNVKRGPLQYAKSKFHDTEYSSLHKTSPLLCAACHEYRNALGVSVLSIYTEWRQSPYAARGIPCQECHMPVVPGTSVPEPLKPSDHVINLHRIVGGSNASKMSVGLELKIDSVTRTSTAADVQVVVTSTRVGHSAPGGDPRVFRVDGSEVALRRDTARRLILRRENSDKNAAKGS